MFCKQEHQGPHCSTILDINQLQEAFIMYIFLKIKAHHSNKIPVIFKYIYKNFQSYDNYLFCYVHFNVSYLKALQCRRSGAVVERSHAGDRGSIPDRERLKSLKQKMTNALPNAWQLVRV